MTARIAEGRTVAVVGAGPAGLMAAEVAAAGGATVTVFDRMPSAGRKFLLAGRGGLNLTHGEPFDVFATRYGEAEARLRPVLEAFSPDDLRAWCETLGQATFVGSSGRVFPRAFKASPLLRAWLRRLEGAGVRFRPRHRWTGWAADGALGFETPDGPATYAPDAAILALGGASWPQLGSDGAWTGVVARAGIAVAPLVPSNCAFEAPWSPMFRDRFEGQPLKAVRLMFEGHAARGDAVVTRAGLEGGAVYALSGPLRHAIDRDGEAVLHVTLRPDATVADLAAKLRDRPAKRSLSTHLRKALHLAPVAIGLLQEAAHGRGAPLNGLHPDDLAAFLDAVPVRLTRAASIARAISSAGGVRFDGVDASLMLQALPGTFVAGEMMDWEAPTGGYLLQSAFATGATAGRGALAWVARSADRSPAEE